jgi:hypothetical protein
MNEHRDGPMSILQNHRRRIAPIVALVAVAALVGFVIPRLAVLHSKPTISRQDS